jgi:pimeloyl-ACP methyl ester carboxylesterase
VIGEFVRVITSDGLELQGVLATQKAGPVDTSLLHIHGLAGNFYENRLVDYVAEAAVSRRANFLSVNNRGHDYISDFICQQANSPLTYRQIGGIYEIFEECILDIEAWIRFLKTRGTRRIILQGHSHGALKAVYYMHNANNPDIVGLVLLSPSDDFGMQRSRLAGRFEEALRVAADLVSQGKGASLMPEAYFHYPISARTYMDTFGAGSHLKIFNLSKTDTDGLAELASIGVPVLVIVGSVDEEFVGSPEEYISGLSASMRNVKDFSGHVVDGAPHNYLEYEEEVAKRTGEWLGERFGK